jgi:hypothetical protein
MDFDYLALFFFAVAGLVTARFVYRIVWHGGLRGAMFGARVDRTVGVLELGRRGLKRLRLKVHRLEAPDAGSPSIGIELVSTSFGAAGMMPIALTTEEARALAGLLIEASGK